MGIRIINSRKKNIIHPTSRDAEAIKKGTVPSIKKSSASIYSKKAIRKPWGFEYPCYKNAFIDVWEMRIFPGHSTSFHCHPGKDALKIVLEGEPHLETFSGNERLAAGNFRLVKGNATHRNVNKGKRVARIIEIESPPDKRNLIRFEDIYGRRGTPYGFSNIGLTDKMDTPMKNLFSKKAKRIKVESSSLYCSLEKIEFGKNAEKKEVIYLAKLKNNTWHRFNTAKQKSIIGKKFKLLLALDNSTNLAFKKNDYRLSPGEGFLVSEKVFSVTSKNGLLLMV
jgi:mannose-6-phosphate isomerase-like protein (cupin superfamily)